MKEKDEFLHLNSIFIKDNDFYLDNLTKNDLSESFVRADSTALHINYRVKSKTAHRGCQTAQISSCHFAALNERKTIFYDRLDGIKLCLS